MDFKGVKMIEILLFFSPLLLMFEKNQICKKIYYKETTSFLSHCGSVRRSDISTKGQYPFYRVFSFLLFYPPFAFPRSTRAHIFFTRDAQSACIIYGATILAVYAFLRRRDGGGGKSKLISKSWASDAAAAVGKTKGGDIYSTLNLFFLYPTGLATSRTFRFKNFFVNTICAISFFIIKKKKVWKYATLSISSTRGGIVVVNKRAVFPAP